MEDKEVTNPKAEVIEESIPVIPQKPGNKKTLLLSLLLVFIIVASYLIYKYVDFGKLNKAIEKKPQTSTNLVKFKDEAEYTSYLETSNESVGGMSVGNLGTAEIAPAPGGISTQQKAIASPVADRVSQTNVQVFGIDEPDIVKTDGKNIYISSQNLLYRELETIQAPTIERAYPPYNMPSQTKIVSSYPPDTSKLLSNIERNGNLLLSGNLLLVITGNDIFTYDVSDPANPNEAWNLDFDDRQEIVDTRLFNNNLYVVIRSFANSSGGCLIPYMGERNITCTDIYHPNFQITTDSTFTVLKINTKNGEEEGKISFVGTASSSVLYMNPERIFVTYTYYPDPLIFFYDFFNKEGRDLVDSTFLTRLDKTRNLDISMVAKMTEFSSILNDFLRSKTSDEALTFQTELQNRMNEYSRNHARELEKSGVVAVDTNNLEILGNATVAGHPLNQFSLDFFDGTLRIATTIDSRTDLGGINDVYTFDDKMNQIGSLLGFEEGERIYSARFIGNLGYIVTFKETDPFFVVDLTDPKKPTLKGKLEIPGYSSYLHPLTNNLILGVGKEEDKVKLSLFDVSNSENPTEISKYLLDEYWTDVLTTHHAFLQDEKHKIFFIPGSKGGYVVSYTGNELKLVTAISSPGVMRSLFINDYFYAVGSSQIIVYDENSWEKIKTISI